MNNNNQHELRYEIFEISDNQLNANDKLPSILVLFLAIMVPLRTS